MRIASELQGTILKVFISRGKAIAVECGSADVQVDADGKHVVWARVLNGQSIGDTGYLNLEVVKTCDSDEFARAAAAEINYPVTVLQAM